MNESVGLFIYIFFSHLIMDSPYLPAQPLKRSSLSKEYIGKRLNLLHVCIRKTKYSFF
jgi:hypothetical protein